jgi:PHP family Zn ribbon phosphoesterase
MLKEYRMDLHIHTCLSPCGELEMVPKEIVSQACERGIDVIGITDHNSAENVPAVKKAAEKNNLEVLGGMEVTTREEVHLLSLFDSDERLMELQRVVYENLAGENDEEVFGEQLVVDEKSNVLDLNKRLLIGATNLSVDELVDLIHSLDGLAIASHVDRDRFGIVAQLGFIPQNLPLDALEISARAVAEGRLAEFSESFDLPLVTFSDAHILNTIGRSTTHFLIEEVNMKEMKMALLSQEGRRTSIP